MQKTSPFTELYDHYDYFYEANIMGDYIRTCHFRYSIRELCDKTFHIGAYEPEHHYSVEKWEMLVSEMTLLLENRIAKRRTNVIRKELLTVVRMKTMREELVATAMSPERVYSMTERYGASAAYETFA
jgi:hypothetical protein